MTTAQIITLDLNDKELALITHALRAFLADFGHDEPDVVDAIRAALAKLAAASSTVAPIASEVAASS